MSKNDLISVTKNYLTNENIPKNVQTGSLFPFSRIMFCG